MVLCKEGQFNMAKFVEITFVAFSCSYCKLGSKFYYTAIFITFTCYADLVCHEQQSYWKLKIINLLLVSTKF